MLAITPSAAETIKSLLSASGLSPDSAGLRIAAGATAPDRQPGLQLSLTPVPDRDDQVVERDGAHVFVEPAAADTVEDKVLQADATAGQARFILDEQ